jgi:hypothetical protein
VLFQEIRHQSSADREFIRVALKIYVVDERLKACEHIYPTRASILSKYSPRTVIGRFSSREKPCIFQEELGLAMDDRNGKSQS